MYVDVLFPLVGVHNCVNFAFIHLTNGKKKGSSNSKIDFSIVAAT